MIQSSYMADECSAVKYVTDICRMACGTTFKEQSRQKDKRQRDLHLDEEEVREGESIQERQLSRQHLTKRPKIQYICGFVGNRAEQGRTFFNSRIESFSMRQITEYF